METSKKIGRENISNGIVTPANKEVISNKYGSILGDVDLIQTNESEESAQAREEKYCKSGRREVLKKLNMNQVILI